MNAEKGICHVLILQAQDMLPAVGPYVREHLSRSYSTSMYEYIDTNNDSICWKLTFL
jgi:hypothetical protein